MYIDIYGWFLTFLYKRKLSQQLKAKKINICGLKESYARAEKYMYVENCSNVGKNLVKALEKLSFPPKFLYCMLKLNHEYTLYIYIYML